MAGGYFSRAGGESRLSILIYHRVLPHPDPYLKGVIDAAAFDAEMSILASSFRVISLHEALRRLDSNSLPGRSVCITFDDGYADNADVALPILQKYGMQATFFIAAGYINGGIMWNDVVLETMRTIDRPALDLKHLGLDIYPVGTLPDRIASANRLIADLKYLSFQSRAEVVSRIIEAAGVALPRDLMMDSNRLLRLDSAGMEIGGHTLRHPILARSGDEDARHEIHEGKRILEEITGKRLRYFAYPNGKPGTDYTSRHVAMVREAGFSAAVSTARGAAAGGSDRFQLPRYTPWEKNPARFMLQMALNYRKTRHPVA